MYQQQPYYYPPQSNALNPIRLLLGAGLALIGALFVFGTFSMSWVESNEDYGDDTKLTPWELWMGQNNGEDLTLNLDGDNGGFGNVRWIERFLILLPLGGLVLIGAGAAYVFGKNTPYLKLASALGASIMLLALPFAWNALCKADWRSSSDDTYYASEDNELINKLVDELDSTVEFKWMAGAALGITLFGFLLETLVGKQQVPYPYYYGQPPYPPPYQQPYGQPPYQQPYPPQYQQPYAQPPYQQPYVQQPPAYNPPQAPAWGLPIETPKPPAWDQTTLTSSEPPAKPDDTDSSDFPTMTHQKPDA
jgi:uncharacterized membrane protein